MVNTETMDNTTPSPLLESLVTPKAFDTPVGEEQSKCVFTVFEAKTLVYFIYFHFFLPLWLLFGIFVQKVFDTNLNSVYQYVRNWEI